MYSNPRAHRVGRLLALLIEPFILALAYAHTAPLAYATDTTPLAEPQARYRLTILPDVVRHFFLVS